MIAVWIIVAIVVVLVIVLVALYNRLVQLRNRVDNAWAQIDVQLKRRRDLIPNLVETVKGYAAHERGTFEAVTQARAAAAGAQGPAQTAAAEDMLTQALGRLFAVAEAYPELRATENFQQLQAQLQRDRGQDRRLAPGLQRHRADLRQRDPGRSPPSSSPVRSTSEARVLRDRGGGAARSRVASSRTLPAAPAATGSSAAAMRPLPGA